MGNSWDSKHHNWSGHSLIETGIQMSWVDMQDQISKFSQFALMFQHEALLLVAKYHILVLTVAG